MRILVTGCAGFIGWKVCELLLMEGHIVVGVDNLNNAYDVRLKKWRLNKLKRSCKFYFYRLEITDLEELRGLFYAMMEKIGLNKGIQECSLPLRDPDDDVCIDAVINLAARAGVRQSLEDPWKYYDSNVNGTLNLLDICRQYGVKKFVLASTSSVYGDGQRPFREEAPTDHPISPYASSKKAAETLCYTYHHLYDLDVTVLRYFTVYGPAGRPDMSIFRFVRWIVEGEPIVVHGDGTQERDFTYVDDIARGTVLALRPVGYKIINLGGENPVAIHTVISLLEELVGHRAEVTTTTAHLTDVQATWADISQARTILKWEPQVSIDQGLKYAMDWYLAHRIFAQKVALS